MAEDQDEVDVVGRTLFFSDELPTVKGAIDVLDHCDHMAHVKIGLCKMIAGEESDALVFELASHFAIVDLRKRVQAHAARLESTELPKAILRFESGAVAVWDDAILGWHVTGSERAWGDPVELLKIYGTSFTVLEEVHS